MTVPVLLRSGATHLAVTRGRALLVCVVLALVSHGLGGSGVQALTGDAQPASSGLLPQLHQAALLKAPAGGSAALACTATLVAPAWILTAAHCFEGATMQVRTGSPTWSGGGQVHSVTAVVRAPTTAGAKPDVALARIDPPAGDKGVAKSYGEVPVGASLMLAGWGARQGGGQPSKDLRVASAQVVAADGCNGATDNLEMCVKDLSAAQSSPCFGDSGGPALTQSGGQMNLIGVISRSGGHDAACSGAAIVVSLAPLKGWIATSVAAR